MNFDSTKVLLYTTAYYEPLDAYVVLKEPTIHEDALCYVCESYAFPDELLLSAESLSRYTI